MEGASAGSAANSALVPTCLPALWFVDGVSLESEWVNDVNEVF